MSPITINAAELVAIMPRCPTATRAVWPVALSAAMAEASITTPLRAAAFLAQVAHETGELRWLTEDLNYSAQAICDLWPPRFPTLADALPYAHAAEKLANKVYCNRLGNGPESSGDGWKFRGRGVFQHTGRDAYVYLSTKLGADFVTEPERLTEPGNASRAAALYWVDRGLNILADVPDFVAITRAINGGLNGITQRKAYYERAKLVLNAA